MQAEQIQRVSVVGAGQMGLGIAQVCAAQGLEVILSDVGREHAERAVERMRAGLDRLVARGKLGRQELEDTLGRIKVESDSPVEVDLVIEAATEDRTLKLELFRRLDRRTQPNALLCSNTSSISISALAGVTQRPGQGAGMHFMNPVPRMKLVEIWRGDQTRAETRSGVAKFAELGGG